MVFTRFGPTRASTLHPGRMKMACLFLEWMILSPQFACFVTPHVLLEVTYRCLYDNMQPGVRNASALQGMDINALDYWAGGAMQRAISQLFSTSTLVPSMLYSSDVTSESCSNRG